jgi:tetratricopeptide (TPR) repeat protein
VLGGFVRRARAAVHDPVERGLAVGAGGVFLVWLVHTSVDWLHLIPGVTGIALCAAAVLTGPWRRADPRADASHRGFVIVVGAALVLLAGGFVGRAALADRLVDDGRSRVATDPIEALAKATDSLALNDEALPAYYLRAAAWARLDDYPRARRALVEATRREPHDPVPWGLLGDLATRRGLSREARAAYAHALSLNPRDPALGDLARAAPTPR